jgi:ABC-2 type transport system ATP-binding protein
MERGRRTFNDHSAPSYCPSLQSTVTSTTQVPGEPPLVVEVRDLSKRFQVPKKAPGLVGSLRALVRREYLDVEAVQSVSFSLRAGELVGFLGPNGAGKTTTLKMLAGLLHPSDGQVAVLGHQPWRREAALQRQFSLVMGQKNQLWWDLPALESFRLNAEIYGVAPEQLRATLDELVELLELEPLLGVQVRKLSLGERMKCELAAALLHRPRILYLDEPTIGLDVLMQKRIREFIRAYNCRHNATIILTSHYMDDVRELCERVLIVNHGRLIYDGRLDEIVQRYAGHKELTASFSEPVQRAALDELGEIVDYQPLRATIKVARGEVASRAARLLAELPVADLAVNEPDVEDVIRQVFSEQLVPPPCRPAETREG